MATETKTAVVEIAGGLILTALAPVFCCFSLMMISVLAHNIQLHRFASNLYDYPLLPKTKVIERYSLLERSDGNGDFCVFSVEQTLVSALTREEIETYYQDVALPEVTNMPLFRQVPPLIRVLFDDEISTDVEVHYRIVLGDTSSPGMDPRCRW